MIRFVLENVSDAATLTSTPVISEPNVIDNVKKLGRNRFVRTEDTDTDFTIYGNMENGEARDISALVIARHNFSVNIVYQINLYDGTWDENHNQSGNNLYNSGQIQVSQKDAATALYMWGFFDWGAVPWEGDEKAFDNREWYDLVWWADKEGLANGVVSGVKSFSIEFTPIIIGGAIYCNDYSIYCNYDDPANQLYCSSSSFESDANVEPGIPYYEIGRIYLGIFEEPSYTISPNHTISWVEKTQQYRPSSGTLRSDYTTTNRQFEFSLNTIPEADRIDLHKKLIEKGKRKDFYISMFYDDALWDKDIDYSGLVKFTKEPKYIEYINGYYKAKFTMEEV